MNFRELMSKGWKGELPSDTLLRENPTAYDSSPLAQIVYFADCAVPPLFGYMVTGALGYISKCGKTVLYGVRSAPQGRRHYPAMVPMETLTRRQNPKGTRFTEKKVREKVVIHGMTLHKGVCAICIEDTGLTRHHLTPRQVRHLAPINRRTNKTVRICFPCHRSLHLRFTNDQLLNIPWEDVAEIVLEIRKAPQEKFERFQNTH